MSSPAERRQRILDEIAKAASLAKRDPKNVQLFAISAEGKREALAEPFDSFFYKGMPKDPPLTTSINATTLGALKRDVEEPREPTLARQFELDALNLEDQGEHLRADLVRMLARQQM